MPRSTFKSLFMETAVFIGLFVLAGHLSINFWDRYVIRSELSLMKCSLHSLKDTLNNIGNAYDNLQNELNTLMKLDIIEKNLQHIGKKNNHKQFLDRRKQHELQMQVIIDAKNKKHKHCQKHKMNKTTIRNATTITRNPLKTTGAGDEDKCYVDKVDKILQSNDCIKLNILI